MAKKPALPKRLAIEEGVITHDEEECARMCDYFYDGVPADDLHAEKARSLEEMLRDNGIDPSNVWDEPLSIHEDPEEVAAIEAQLDEYDAERWMDHDFDPCEAAERDHAEYSRLM